MITPVHFFYPFPSTPTVDANWLINEDPGVTKFPVSQYPRFLNPFEKAKTTPTIRLKKI